MLLLLLLLFVDDFTNSSVTLLLYSQLNKLAEESKIVMRMTAHFLINTCEAIYLKVYRPATPLILLSNCVRAKGAPLSFETKLTTQCNEFLCKKICLLIGPRYMMKSLKRAEYASFLSVVSFSAGICAVVYYME